MSGHAAILAAQGLGRRVGGRWLWRGVDLGLAAGERLGLAGPTGAGKTVLLRTLVALEPADEGGVRFDGQPVARAGVPALRARVIYLAQRPQFRPGSVRDILAAPWRLAVRAGQRFDGERAGAVLAQFGRDAAFLAKDVARLSGGEAQLVALARALLCDPQVLLLDEPTAAMDAELRDCVEATIGHWQGSDPGRALIWTSHDAAQLDRMTSRRFHLRPPAVAE